ncbi:hypothetical protein PUNSTDRAFT_93317 [Punctularia strigosozonata HHB-11173 SS5]|uniref:Extracellular metalloproteinase n=1 Tax=Punctularia strigosozonata (strain HHB-11173) TaxID=741275 RepID=R7S4R2_PUNST|nr:uncharacterized protein PUNSTDRAFT_93317 [Punctularia strigosozonata HHB-11173 SS5]EIN04226.1 hypothetical protein PUNSTDRAFT_93317 [Punctularia strigosozonata HHB-11173 SS5]
MRSFFLTSLAVAGLASAAVAHIAPDAERPYRKSLGFGPVHPHAVFRSAPYQVQAAGLRASPDVDPLDVATTFVVNHLRDVLSETSSFVLREDSYTDEATGVTHAYFRQIVNGVEVIDGDLNVNVKDRVVLSYGDSFFHGPAPTVVVEEGASERDPHGEYCSRLESQLLFRPEATRGEQVALHASEAGNAELIQALHQSNCGSRSFVAESAIHTHNDEFTNKPALLAFMMHATPSESVAQDINANFRKHIVRMRSTFDTAYTGDHATTVEYIHNVPDTVNPVKARIGYIQVPEGGKTVLLPVWKFEVEMADNWYEAAVSVTKPHRIISVVDWASDAYAPIRREQESKQPTYHVFPWGVNDPSEGNRTFWNAKPDAIASPVGWHTLPFENDPQYFGVRRKAGSEKFRNTTTTWGNNVFAHENWEGRNAWVDNYRPDAGASLNFSYAYDPRETGSEDALAEAKGYINATVTQLFYTSNLVHDLFYRYGFDEVSGNFQQHNFGRGGAENDAVIANAQDGSGYNNANFMTPPDGQNGRCRMYLWNTANPYRDGDLEAGIVIHELAHGLSTRLTGGPANSGCLGWGESGGMGEGWGDFLATTIRSTANYSDYPMGEWAANRVGGIRNYVYSLDETINPSTYKTLDKPGYWGVHAIGEVWAEILWVVSQKLIAKHGYSDTLFPPQPLENGTVPAGDFYRPREHYTLTTASGAQVTKAKPLVPKHGNSLAVQLVINGMKLQPCRPSFFEARDAIVQADQVLTSGENFCELWKGFSERGLGPDARVDGRTPWGGGVRTNDYEVPLACKEEKIPEDPEDVKLDFII